MNSPKISVIIPCYNVEKYLRQCLDSVLNQTLQDIEIICIDDGSSDGTLELLKEFQKKDNRVKVITQKNAGAGAARNNGLRVATGEYLSFLDSDDFFEPNMLEEAFKTAEKYQVDFVVYNSDQYHMDQECFVNVDWTMCMQDIPPYMPFTYRQLTGNVFKTFVGWAWDKLYRRSFVLQQNLWFQEQRTTNDMLFVFSALVVAKKIAVVNKILAHQRRGSSESLSVTREKSWHCFYEALTALKQRLKDEEIFWEIEQDYINYALHFSLWHLNTLAEPTHQLLKDKLCNEWFDTLGIANKPESYFYEWSEYEQFARMMRRKSKDIDADSYRSTKTQKESERQDFLEKYGIENSDSLVENIQDAYYINKKHDILRDTLMRDQTLWERFQYMYWWQKYQNYSFVHEHLKEPYKEEYMQRMCREFKRASQQGQLLKDVFSDQEWKNIQNMIKPKTVLSWLRTFTCIRKLAIYIPIPVKQTVLGGLNSLRKEK